ncbi:MAG: acyl-CoA thioesterase [Gammaproteobacteria bacterium]|nr:acyl-CoA thioesterase [Gammaproteobacteria bacterium]
MENHPNSKSRTTYPKFYDQDTRWLDNDAYGHVNNVAYYSFFDTAVNKYLIDHCGLNVGVSQAVGYVVSSSCNYHSSAAYPADLEVGLRVNKIGNKSVEYGVAVFKKDSKQALATGHFTHVYVDRSCGKSIPIPQEVIDGLQALITD